MLRVRTTLNGWSGGPGVLTTYFETPLEDAAAAIRVREYVHTFIGTAAGLVFSNIVDWDVQPEVDVVTAASGSITNTLSDSTAHASSGGGGTTAAPLASAGLIKYQTAVWVGGKHVAGRSYIGPMAAACVDDDGTVTAAKKAAVDDALTAYLATLDAGDSQVVWHRPKAGAGGSIASITGATLAKKIAVLTSRRD